MFRCDVAPIRIETGRYDNLLAGERICRFCNEIEDEMLCGVYDNIRTVLSILSISAVPKKYMLIH